MEKYPAWDEWDDFAKSGFVNRVAKFLYSNKNIGRFFSISEIYRGLYEHWPIEHISRAIEVLSKCILPKNPEYPKEFQGKRILHIDQKRKDYAVGIPKEYGFLNVNGE